jgi:hypothetical protein
MVTMRSLPSWLALAALATPAACDLPIPTSAPSYDTEWSIPGKSTTISVNTLLPGGVTATSDNSAFQVSVSPSSTTFSRRLAQDCPSCGLIHGVVAPKPPFSGGGSESFALPSTLTSAMLVGDTLRVVVKNGFNFDPIRPSASARGYIAIRVLSGATLLGRDSVDGSAYALAPGDSVVRKIPLSGTITGANGMQVSAMINSPLGDPVAIDTSGSISVTGGIGAFFVSSAQVSVAAQPVSAAPTDLDLSDVDRSISKRASGGSLLLTIDNPFNVTGNLSVTFTGGALPITKPLSLSNGTSTTALTFTKDELLALLGWDVSVGFSGTVAGANVSVSPGQVVSVSSRLQVSLRMGGGN